MECLVLPVTESSQVGEARRIAAALAGTAGFDETERGKVALVATEAANNLVQHAAGGELVLRVLGRDQADGLEILSLDKGPGMRNVAECLRDGFSTAGTPGTGLGAILRLSDLFDIYSLPGMGTALLSRLRAKAPAARPQTGTGLEIGAVCLPKPGETVCGDAWDADDRGGRSRILVADGLGHGPAAAEASGEAVRVFRQNPAPGPAEILEAIHAALRGTRGAAAAAAEVDLTERTIRFAGIGNIAAAVVSPGETRSMVSHNGIVGHQMRKVQEFVYPLPEGGMLVMASDGLTTQWRLDRYPGLLAKHPGLAAGVLYRDFNRGRDDVTVLAARPKRETT